MIKHLVIPVCASVLVLAACSKSDSDLYSAGNPKFEAGFQSYRNKDYQRAKDAFIEAANKGHPTAQSFLGTMYLEGEGVRRDLKQAFQWFEKASDGGDVSATFDLAVMYDGGEGVSRDIQKAANLYRKAAEGGMVRAQVNLANMYFRGEGVAKSNDESYRWYCLAAKAPLQEPLPANQTAGMTTVQALNFKLLWRAFSEEHKMATKNCRILRGMLSESRVAELDAEIKSMWMKGTGQQETLVAEPSNAPVIKAPDIAKLTIEADSGDSNSQLELAVYYEGRLYQNSPNLDLAHRWFLAAAKQDNYLAQLALARLALKAHRAIVRNDFVRTTSGSARGEADESIIDAIAWFEIAKLGAKKNGVQVPPPAAEAEFYEKYKPSPAQREEGQRQAIEWRNKFLGGGSAPPTSTAPSVTEVPAAPAPQASIPATSLSPKDLVTAMVKAAASDQFVQIAAPKSSLDSLPKPERRDRKVAREKNTAGLEALKKSDFASAIDRFTEGKNADPSDIELVNNLGYALMMAGKLSEAKTALIDTLTIDSSRGAAWSNLGQLFAKTGDESSAVACFKLTYYFSKAPDKTIEFYHKLAESDSDERVKAAATKAVPLFAKIQPVTSSVRYHYQKLLDALPPGPAGIGAPSKKVIDLLTFPTSADDWSFVRELEADLGQCSTGSACARETEITQAREKRKAYGLRAPS